MSLDDELLQKVREAALRDHTSVNALVREYLQRYVDATQRRLEALEAFEAFDALDELATRTRVSTRSSSARRC